VGRFPQTGPAEWLDRARAGLCDIEEPWTPDHGRRCLDDEEMQAAGLALDGNGRWTRVKTPAQMAFFAKQSAARALKAPGEGQVPSSAEAA
jgi:hypothetical protein